MAARTGVADQIIDMHLRSPKISKRAIARRVGCHPNNVDYVLGKYLGKQSVEDLRAFQEHKADIFDSVVMRSVASLTPNKLAKANAVQLMTVAGIAFDKSQLVKGLATGINVSVLLDVAAAIRERVANPQVIREPIDASVERKP